MSPLGFKARVGCLICIAEANVIYAPQDPPLVLHLLTSWWPARSWSCPHILLQRWGCRDSNSCSQNICEPDALPTELNRDRLCCLNLHLFELASSLSTKIILLGVDANYAAWPRKNSRSLSNKGTHTIINNCLLVVYCVLYKCCVKRKVCVTNKILDDALGYLYSVLWHSRNVY